MTNTWKSGISKCTGEYCGIPFSGTIIDSIRARVSHCDVEISLDSPINVYGQTRDKIWADSESIVIL